MASTRVSGCVLLLTCIVYGTEADGERPRAPDPREADFEWKELVGTNPYPNPCSADKLATKEALRLCILEHIWIEQIPSNMPRMTYGQYDFSNKTNRLLPPRDKTDPKDPTDCLISSRTKQRDEPSLCYPVDETLNTRAPQYEKFIAQIINDLRFTFDFILYDESPYQANDSHLWYLMLYIKLIAKEMPNPYAIVRILNDAEVSQADAVIKLKDIDQMTSILEEEFKSAQTAFIKKIEEVKGTVNMFKG